MPVDELEKLADEQEMLTEYQDRIVVGITRESLMRIIRMGVPLHLGPLNLGAIELSYHKKLTHLLHKLIVSMTSLPDQTTLINVVRLTEQPSAI